jgi:ABC-type Fe3+ transport system substrate-binding protein
MAFGFGRIGGLAALALAALIGGAQALTFEEVANLQGPERQKTLEEGARKEGKVTFYHTMIVDQVGQPIIDGFQKKYPFVKVESIRAAGQQLLQRIMLEQQARSIFADVVMADNVSSFQNANVAAPFNSPLLAEMGEQNVGPGRIWVAQRNSWQGIAWNTSMVKDAEAPKTWEDLLDPKWKDKLTWSDSSETGNVRVIMHLTRLWGEEKAVAYLKKLAAQNIKILPGSVRAVLDQVIAGEFPIGVSMSMHHIALSKAMGAPVNGVATDPVISKSTVYGLVKGAPHPHAAMLLIDYLMDKDGGQAILRDRQYPPGHPGLKASPELDWIVPARSGKKELVLTAEEEEKLLVRGAELNREIFR